MLNQLVDLSVNRSDPVVRGPSLLEAVAQNKHGIPGFPGFELVFGHI